jgi:competence protein ComEC
MLTILVGYIWHGLSTVVDYAVAPAVAWIVQASRFFARAPVLETGQLWRAGLALCVGLLAAPVVLAVAGWRLPGPLDALVPGLWRARRWMAVRRRRARGKALAVCTVLVLFAAAVGWLVYPSLQHGVLRSVAAVEGGWPSCLEVRVLDVGQGNAILIRTPDHHAVLCDGGPAGCNLEFQLRTLGVECLEAVCITHPHADHFAGLLECAKDLKAKTVIDGVEVVQPPQSGQATTGKSSGFTDSGQEARNYVELRQELASRGCAHVLACTGQSATIGGLKLSFFAPTESIRLAAAPAGASSTQGQEGNPWLRPARAPTGDELNGDSVVVVAEWQGYKFLLPGDAEAAVLQSYSLPAVDVLVVPHHGSRVAVSSELLERLQVRAAAISVGRQNTFGHPDPATVSCLKQRGLAILRTDQRGWICFDVSAGQLREVSEK